MSSNKVNNSIWDLSTQSLRIMATYSDIGNSALGTPTILTSSPLTARRLSRGHLLVGDNPDCQLR